MNKDKASQDDIYKEMRKKIEAGTYSASSRLPSVRTLAREFKASPNTISKVVSRLMESGLCTARRGVGLFVRSLPSRKLTLVVGSTSPEPKDDFNGEIERRLAERCKAEGIEIERYYIIPGDPTHGPHVDRIRPGRLIICLGIAHEPYFKELAELRRPMLVVGSAPNRCNASSVVPNSFRAGYLAGRYLIRKGCRRIAFVGRTRVVRGVSLPDAGSMKELSGLNYAFLEELNIGIPGDLTFTDITQVAARASQLSSPADGVVMPDADGVEVVQALKALGPKVERVVMGDDRILARQRRPAAVVVRRDEVADLVLGEMNRLIEEQTTTAYRSLEVDCELYEPPA